MMTKMPKELSEPVLTGMVSKMKILVLNHVSVNRADIYGCYIKLQWVLKTNHRLRVGLIACIGMMSSDEKR